MPTTSTIKRIASRVGWRIATFGTVFATPGILFCLWCFGALFAYSGASFGAGGVGYEPSESLLLELFKAVLVALATWAALKVEIASARITAENAKDSADEAHKRIDKHLEKGH
jgi:hypothetical protein